MTVIKTEDLSFSYRDEDRLIPVLKNISIQVEKGEFVAILGHNGSGKSTLAKLINMILTEENGVLQGKIEVLGKDISHNISEDEAYELRRRVGMVHQNPDNQIVATTVEEDVAFGPENLGIPREEIRSRVDEALQCVGMTEYLKHAPHKLSGGQKQRVAIAGIIAMRPDVIIFDESTAMLDPFGRDDVMNTVRKLNMEENKTIIHITHYMNEAALADRVIVLNEGQVFKSGTPEEVFSCVEELNSVRLDVPQVTELCYLLKKAGLPIDRMPTRTKTALQVIKDALEKAREVQ